MGIWYPDRVHPPELIRLFIEENFISSERQTRSSESVSHPWSQSKGLAALDLIELKLCSREIGNFWNLYFNGISLGDPVLSCGTKPGLWESSLEQWICCLSQLVWGPADSQWCHEAVSKSVVPERVRTWEHNHQPQKQTRSSAARTVRCKPRFASTLF